MGAPARKRRNKDEDMATASARLEARIPKAQKMLFERAAELKGQTLTDFLIDSLHNAAVKVVEEHSVMKLTLEDQRIFVEALMNPPAPNAALTKAAKRYRQMTQR
jgi:uncharacterized protein (DUF1778 family)